MDIKLRGIKDGILVLINVTGWMVVSFTEMGKPEE